jgi:Cu+-exporting ATPase
LDETGIAERLLEFNEEDTQIINVKLPSIHCSSCIWILENLDKLSKGVLATTVNFTRKEARITFNPSIITLRELAELLSKIGYEPLITLKDYDQESKTTDYTLLYKLGVAGFAFGNIMFLSFPEYFEVGEFWLEKFKHLFRWIMFAFALPVVFYAASDYFTSAYKGLRNKMLNIDVPIALGVLVLFIRSTVEVAMDWGSGFFDSLAGLVFFLLLGKFFQQKTYENLAFDRDYKSYFPMAVTRLKKGKGGADGIEEEVQIYQLSKGDRLLIRNNEIIPADAILCSPIAQMDYSFVTGEADPKPKKEGDTLFAGGRQQGGPIEIEITKTVDQSYLTQLWSGGEGSADLKNNREHITDRIGKRFTITIITIAVISTSVWLFINPMMSLNVFTAVLIVACPCAIALAAPFTLGNLLRGFGKRQLYLKDSRVVERMADIDCIVFDKTGTLTTQLNQVETYTGESLNDEEKALLNSTLRASTHPLSRSLYAYLQSEGIMTLEHYQEVEGSGLSGSSGDSRVVIGSREFVEQEISELAQPKAVFNGTKGSEVHIATERGYKGHYRFINQYRPGIMEMLECLTGTELHVLSGDNDRERARLEELMPGDTQMAFDQKPQDKLKYIDTLQKSGKTVMMIGDGLNDAGALMKANVGISISEDLGDFSPGCDGILHAPRLKHLGFFLSLSRKGIRIINYAFIFSILYNLVGLGFAVTGHLKPVVAAILMPLSSISIVVFTTLMVWLAFQKSKRHFKQP